MVESREGNKRVQIDSRSEPGVDGDFSAWCKEEEADRGGQEIQLAGMQFLSSIW